MSYTTWLMKLYDLDGVAVTAADYDGAVSNTIKHATDRKLTLPLNSIDQLDFTLYLDDPMAAKVRRLSTVVKLWRDVADPVASKTFTHTTSAPIFCGKVVQTQFDGEANTMQVTCMSPLWQLQFRFHLNNHYLKINNGFNPGGTGATGDPWKQSELMFKLIDLVQGAWSGTGASYLGIEKGSWPDVAGEPEPVPYFVQKGSNTWTHIFENLMTLDASPDIIPRYYHADSSSILMYFDTAEKRGSDKSATCRFDYHVGTQWNCLNMTEEASVTPGKFGNYYWLVGQGGPNSGKIATRDDSSRAGLNLSDTDDMLDVGVYQVREDQPDMHLANTVGSPMYRHADAMFQRVTKPGESHTAQLSPAGGTYYQTDFVLGDVVLLNASKGAWVVTSKKQRIQQVTLTQSDNNMETADTLLAQDFNSKVSSDT